MWIILGFFFSAISALALESFDIMKNVKIIRVLPDNVVVVNRGIEDGLSRNDHAKFSNEVAGYSSRAICLKVTVDLSYWKIYRVPNADAFSLDYSYTIAGIADREIPIPTAKLRNRQYPIKDGEAKRKDPGVDPFSIKSDLPDQLTERDLIETVGPERRQLFIERSLNQDQLKRDLEDYRVSVFASPFMRQSINEGESIRYGIRGGNLASKYRLQAQFEEQRTRLRDPVTREQVSTRTTNGQLQFVIHHLSPSVSSLSLVNYNAQRFSELGTPISHWQLGPIGFTWHLFQSKSWEYVDLSYIPLYDTRQTEVLVEGGNKVDVNSQRGIRHGFRFAMKTRINERVAFENLLWVRPFQDITTWEIEEDNLNLVNDLKLVFSLTENLFFDYNLVFQRDKLWRTVSSLPETNTINSLNLRYDFDL
jgi:hypothetical protein